MKLFHKTQLSENYTLGVGNGVFIVSIPCFHDVETDNHMGSGAKDLHAVEAKYHIVKVVM